jgi:heme exporter protein C
MITTDRATRVARIGFGITVLAVIALAGIYVRSLVYTPTERTQGLAQKIFYLHVPAAWATFLAFGIAGVLSVLYLWLKDRRIDLFAEASAEVGVVLATILLTTGPIWAKPIWGTWWVWEPRLTSTLFLFLLFIGYLLLRGAVTDPLMRARFSAVVGVMGLGLIPFIHLTVYLFRSQHPEPIVLRIDGPALPSVMLVTLLTSFGVFTVLYVGLVMQRYALGALKDLRLEREANAAG